MSQETRKVLEMLASGKITAADAEKLMDKLGASSTAGAASAEGATGPRKLRFFRMMMDRPGRDPVNLRIPLAFVRAAVASGAIPPQVSEKLAEKGVDFAAVRELKDDEWEKIFRKMDFDVDIKNGEKVRIFCE